MRNVLYIITTLLGLTLSSSCQQFDGIELDQCKKKIVSFDELPTIVGDTFQMFFGPYPKTERIIDYPIYNFSNYEIGFRQTQLDSSINYLDIWAAGGTYYYFTIEGVEMRMKANKPIPFIFFKDNMYYGCEFLTVYLSSEQAEFYMIDIKEIIEENK